jgi:hypothetical protein
MRSYTYQYHSNYGSDEILDQELKIEQATLSNDRMNVSLKVKGLRPLFVHELQAVGIRSADGEKLLHPNAYYTLNRIPK